MTYQNNSLVMLENIGEDDTALLCMSNLSACCRQQYTVENVSVRGNWFLPSGSTVANETSSELRDFYSERGQVVVRLNLGRIGENGIYRCEIPDSLNVTQTIYIGVYTAGNGE